MSEMKEILVETVERIYKKHVDKETVDVVETGNWAINVWDILNDNEILGIAIAEKYGGAQGDLEDLIGLYYLIGKYAVPIPFVETTLANFILQQLQAQPITSSATFNVIEQGVTVENGKLQGTLRNVAWARHVEQLVTIARSDDQLVIVQVVLQTEHIQQHKNLAGEPRDTVLLNHDIIQQIAITEELLQQFQAYATAAKGAQIAGAIDKVLDLTVQYSKEREQFGRPIHRFQLVQQHLAQLAGEQAIVSAAIENVTAAILKGSFIDEIGYTTIRLDEAVKLVTASAHQVFAAIGVTHEHSLHQYTRRLWSWREDGLTALYWKKQLAKVLLESSEDNVWAYLTNRESSFQLK